jgi:putative phosphoesterase
MKVALLSDIHANSDALKSVLDEARNLGVSSLIIAGDFVGYYYNAQEVMSLLSSWKLIAVSGNHERMLSDWVQGKNHKKIITRYGSGIESASKTLTDDSINWLINLPKNKEFSIDGKTIFLCHGSPWNEDEYLYPDCHKGKIDKVLSYGKDLVIYGHTHYPVVHSYNHQVIVNPGSVGQSRDGRPGACWALWDTKENKIFLKRTNYDVNNLRNQCKYNDPAITYLREVLKNEN